MKKKVSMQNTDRPVKVHGMYGSMHADLFEETGIAGLRGMDLGFLTGVKNRKKNIRPTGKSRETSTAAGAIAVERPVYLGGMSGLEGFGKRPGSGSGKIKTGAASAGVLRKRAGRARTRAKEQESLLRSLGRAFTLRSFLLLMLALVSVSAALILMLFNFKKAVIYGNTKYSEKQIESFITQGKLGENTFVMAMKYHNRAVKGIPFVDRIDIDIVNPSTVRVNITEKPLDAYIIQGDDKIYFSREGTVQTISGRTDENVTLVNGVELVNPETDAHLQTKNQSGMDNVLCLLEALDRYDLKADSIDVNRLGSLTVTFGDVRLAVGKTGYDMKMYKVHQIFPFFKGKSGCISMTGSDFRGDNIVLSPFESEAEKLSKSEGGKNGSDGGNPGASGESENSGAAKAGKKEEDKKDKKEEASEKEADAQKNETAGESTQEPGKEQPPVETDPEDAEKQTAAPGAEKAAPEPAQETAAPTAEKAAPEPAQETAAPTAEKAAPEPAQETAAPTAEKEAAVPAQETVEKAADQTAEPAGQEPVEAAEEKPVEETADPSLMEAEAEGRTTLPASENPLAPVAKNTPE